VTRPWYVLSTRPYHEFVVADALFQWGFDAYVPWIAGKRQVFVRCALDPVTHVIVISIPGVQRLLTDHLGGLWTLRRRRSSSCSS
jgi:hypothetical protein